MFLLLSPSPSIRYCWRSGPDLVRIYSIVDTCTVSGVHVLLAEYMYLLNVCVVASNGVSNGCVIDLLDIVGGSLCM